MNLKPHRRSRLWLALWACAPAWALAAGSATLDSGGGDTSRLHWQDAQTVRMDMADGEGHMVLRQGKLYMVNPQAGSGMPPVLEIGAMMQGFAQAFDAGDGDQAVAQALSSRVQSVKQTGQTETVAGIQGEVHEVVFVDSQGKTDQVQAVFTSDAQVVEMTAAYLAFTGAMIGPERVADFSQAMPKGQRGLLRLGDDLRVQSISGQGPDAGLFELPAAPVSMGDMMKGLVQQIPQQGR